MKEKEMNESKKNKSELTIGEVILDKEFQNKRNYERLRNLEKNKSENANPLYWDLSGGLLGI